MSLSVESPDTPLARGAESLSSRHPGASGFLLLGGSLDAFVARAALADAAQSTLDVQYYLFHADLTGRLLAERFLAAADRGVRVRLLIDDMDTADAEAGIAALDRHPNIEIRLFNPWRNRRVRVLDWVFDLGRVSRRMHTKAFVADGAAAILGGRNIGDEYMQAGESQVFMDVDVLAVGDVVPEVGDAFDMFWNSEYAVPVSALAAAPAADALEQARSDLEAHAEALKASPYARALAASDLVRSLHDGTVELAWGPATLYHDVPQKIATKPKDVVDPLAGELRRLVEGADRDVWVASAYFVPGKSGTEVFCDAVERGVGVHILTNSLAATDVWAVHGGYAPYRKPLLRCGAELYELSVTAFAKERETTVVQDEATAIRLHAKTMVVDDRLSFIGSFNLDPRSAIHNTEIGVLVDSPELAAQVKQLFATVTEPRNSWHVVLGQGGRPSVDGSGNELLWVGADGTGEVVLDREPDASVWRRMGASIVRVLPIENQL